MNNDVASTSTRSYYTFPFPDEHGKLPEAPANPTDRTIRVQVAVATCHGWHHTCDLRDGPASDLIRARDITSPGNNAVAGDGRPPLAWIRTEKTLPSFRFGWSTTNSGQARTP